MGTGQKQKKGIILTGIDVFLFFSSDFEMTEELIEELKEKIEEEIYSRIGWDIEENEFQKELKKVDIEEEIEKIGIQILLDNKNRTGEWGLFDASSFGYSDIANAVFYEDEYDGIIETLREIEDMTEYEKEREKKELIEKIKTSF